MALLESITGFYLPEPDAAIWAGQRGNTNRYGDVLDGGYTLSERKQPDGAGAAKYAFTSLGLPEFSPIGWGVVHQQFLSVTEPPPPYIVGPSVNTNNFGGLVAGSIVTLPLIDPYSMANT